VSAVLLASVRRPGSDVLNPILVKELRQGIRGTLFTGAFLLLHVLMLTSGGVSLSTVNQGPARSMADGLFWFLITIPVLVILPLSGGASMAGEKTAHTLEPVLLTRLTARQIVVGKWAAIALQAALLISSVLPYVVLRYFLGSVDVLPEVLGLVEVWVSCLILTAIAVGLASLRGSALVRWLLLLAVGGYLLSQLQSFLVMWNPWSPLGVRGGWQTFLLVAALGVVGIILLLFLEVGALVLAPPAEARSHWIRLLAVLALLLGIVVSGRSSSTVMVSRFENVLVAWTLIVVTGVAVAVACEDVKDIPGLYAPFFRRRLLRPFRIFLTPGWPSGVWLTSLFLAGVARIAWPRLASAERLPFFVALVGTVFVPLAVVRVLLRSRLKSLPVYLLVHALSGIPALVYGLGQLSDDRSLSRLGLAAASVAPLSALLLGDLPRWTLYVLGAITLGSVVTVSGQAGREFFEIRRCVEQMPERGSGRTEAAAVA
jgi:hypothetical protein